MRDHEPAAALIGPGGPYVIYERLALQAKETLRSGGHLLVEIGEGMAGGVAERLRAAGLTESSAQSDLAGIPRVVAARHVSPVLPLVAGPH